MFAKVVVTFVHTVDVEAREKAQAADLPHVCIETANQLVMDKGVGVVVPRAQPDVVKRRDWTTREDGRFQRARAVVAPEIQVERGLLRGGIRRGGVRPGPIVGIRRRVLRRQQKARGGVGAAGDTQAEGRVQVAVARGRCAGVEQFHRSGPLQALAVHVAVVVLRRVAGGVPQAAAVVGGGGVVNGHYPVGSIKRPSLVRRDAEGGQGLQRSALSHEVRARDDVGGHQPGGERPRPDDLGGGNPERAAELRPVGGRRLAAVGGVVDRGTRGGRSDGDRLGSRVKPAGNAEHRVSHDPGVGQGGVRRTRRRGIQVIVIAVRIAAIGKKRQEGRHVWREGLHRRAAGVVETEELPAFTQAEVGVQVTARRGVADI